MLDHLLASRRARPSRESLRSVLGSAVVHGLLIALLVWKGDAISPLLVGNDVPGPGFGAGPTQGPAGGGGGGSELVEYIEIAASPPAPAVPVEELVVPEEPPEEEVPEVPPTPAPPTPEPAATPTPAPPVVASSGGAGTGTGEGTGPGTGPGAGGGSGGGDGGGIGSGVGPGTGGGGGGEGGIRPPVPVGVFLPPTPPSSVRGKTVELQLAVDAQGRVREVELVSPTGDRAFDARLRRSAMEWRFQPARDPSNRPVAAQFPISFSF